MANLVNVSSPIIVALLAWLVLGSSEKSIKSRTVVAAGGKVVSVGRAGTGFGISLLAGGSGGGGGGGGGGEGGTVF